MARTYQCITCPYETDSATVAAAHEARTGWLGRGETHTIKPVRPPKGAALSTLRAYDAAGSALYSARHAR